VDIFDEGNFTLAIMLKFSFFDSIHYGNVLGIHFHILSDESDVAPWLLIVLLICIGLVVFIGFIASIITLKRNSARKFYELIK
jgi:hypothetical protein